MASIKLRGDTSGELVIEAPAVAGTNTLTLPATTQTLATQNALGVRNLIINGDMRIAQRGTGTTGIVAAGFFDIDRVFYTENTVGGSFDSAQSTDVPSGQGFVNSHKWSVNTTATALTTTGWAKLRHVIEGLNSAHLEWGTANAKTVTLSFWVKSSVTGTYCISINNDDFNRCYIAEYTIDTANTWEKKTITIEGDTSGTWKTDNDRGIIVSWVLDAGADRETTANSWQSGADFATSNQVSWISNAGATFYRTGLQLEVGDTATPFEHRPYDMELARCFRYYWQGISIMNSYATTGCVGQPYKVRMRANPTITWSYGGTANRVYRISDGVQTTLTGPSTPTTTDQLYYIYSTVSSWAASSGTSHNGIITDLVLSAEL